MGKKISIIILGSIVWSLTMIRSGIDYSFGLGFWGANGHDAIWHIALANSLAKGSLNNPVFAGSTLQNYHLGFDILLAFINQITKIPITILYFQIFPPIFAILVGILVYQFVLNWRSSEKEAFWATFLVYFGSSFGFIITFLRDRIFTGESMFWSQQSVSTLINPPFALSLIFILAGLISVQKKNIVLSIIFFGLLIQIKAYSAILILGGLFITTIYSFYISHSTYYLKVFIGSLFLNLILFVLTKSNGLTIFSWQPFWFLETMMTYSDRLGWNKFYSAMTTYKMGHILFKEILFYGIAFLIFLVGNMGLRIVGMIYYVKLLQNKIKIDETIIFITTVMGIAVIIPLFFVQSGTPWNTIQFFYYYLFLFAIIAGIVTSWFNRTIKLFIILVSIIGVWTTLQHYLPKMPQAIVSNNEKDALIFLSKQPDGIVLTYPFDAIKAREAESNPPRPLYLYDSTAYVSALSQKQVFLEDEVNLNIMGYDWKTRRSQILNWYKEPDQIKAQEFIVYNDIKYIYWVNPQRALLGDHELGFTKIFENKEVIIYQYGKDIGSN